MDVLGSFTPSGASELFDCLQFKKGSRGDTALAKFLMEFYILLQMATVIHKVLDSNVPAITGETYQNAIHGGESFLDDVISPIYDVLRKEAQRNKRGTASHSSWRNYDDLNEYFWYFFIRSRKCFKLGWPMDRNAEFFVPSDEARHSSMRDDEVAIGRRMPKTNFVEVRTFWHLYRSFNRMWMFFILAFQIQTTAFTAVVFLIVQTMVIIAWDPSGSITAIFEEDVFISVLSIFITAAFLNLVGAMLDIILSWKAWGNMRFTQILRYLLKFVVAAMWTVVLPIGYSSYVRSPTGLVNFMTSWAANWRSQPLFKVAIAIYLAPNILAALLFFFPSIRKCMEKSDSRIIRLIMWYTIFWILLLICKLAFSYYVEILPLVGPTKQIWQYKVDNYQWHEFFPNATHNIGVIVAIWAPIVLVYLMDAQMWYAIFATIVGGILGAFSHLGEIRTLGMLRSRFESVPIAFRKRLEPRLTEEKRQGHMDYMEERKNIAKFSQVWNEFMHSLRLEDLISHRERDLLLVPYTASKVSVVQWPPFLLASKIPIAVDMAKDFKKKDDVELFNKIKEDDYMYSAVIECYETLREILFEVLEDEDDRQHFDSATALAHIERSADAYLVYSAIHQICKKVETSIQQCEFLTEFRMIGLPMLHAKLERFLKLLLSDADYEDEDLYKSHIINVLQDIMEIITQDVMVEGHDILKKAQPNHLREQRFEKINILLLRNKSWREKVVRLHVLLSEKESAINVPMNLEARRRMTFFTNSLFMTMPHAPLVRNMLSFRYVLQVVLQTAGIH
ncbi:hypothetical protein Cgig2_018756 [Carnegiea gigantea]|uniref:1,3-beta-glucan synthase component FKS1-like domain-containing protein n=1 Tax=Carnegiea gigantea TaxID=171969 RepID=A0A9Q1GSU7_9CARY|nr:hypothetical protein Cgig2_018756 [Carnegiea gigantea]